MDARKEKISILLDTNIIIQTEDNKKIGEIFSELINKCHEHGIKIYVHEASIDDINRDNDFERRTITLSKIKKYPLLEKIPYPTREGMAKIYGDIKNDNDFVDVRLLHTLSMNIISLMVTEDVGLRTRALKAGLSNRVLNVVEALNWIKQTYEHKAVSLPYIQHLKCHQISINEEIFSSLKADYNEFEEWYLNTCVPSHRDCWTITDKGRVAALSIWKSESGTELNSLVSLNIAANNDKILKVCTFKVVDDCQGSKIGEHLLKQILWHSLQNKFDGVYLTAFPEKQTFLISFLEEFGFSNIGKNARGESVLYKKIHLAVEANTGREALDYHMHNYPAFLDDNDIRKFIIPIQGQFHYKLFPEYTPFSQRELFDYSHFSSVKREIPGNTMRKVYLCHANVKKIREGDLLIFYMSKNSIYKFSQRITIIGVVDGITVCQNIEDVLSTTAKRSVYSIQELETLLDGSKKDLIAIDFLEAGHLVGVEQQLPPDLDTLMRNGILSSAPYTIREIDNNQYSLLKKMVRVSYESFEE